MGQAWCKEKSTKAQDSKSPLDRVFLRCAHRIYPGLKEEGSVLGGATQRVTSSEIGYASSPPRELLTRGQSIDSVDRPFHPNDWVDVNLEVPGTPRATAMTTASTNSKLDAALYPPTSFTPDAHLRDFVPVPPPRRRKTNRGRPLPPKPDDETPKTDHVDPETTDTNSSGQPKRNYHHEPLYSSVKSPKTREVFEHKVNGTGTVIPNILLAASKSNRERSQVESPRTRPKNSSTVSLPNYSELGVQEPLELCEEEEEELKVHKITAAESLPSLVTSCSRERRASDERVEDRERSVDEVDFPRAGIKDLEDSILLEAPKLTSTPLKKSENGWVDEKRLERSINAEAVLEEKLDSGVPLDCPRTSQSDLLLLKDASSKHALESTNHDPLPNSRPKLLTRSISEESLPREMLDVPEETDFFAEDKGHAIVENDTKIESTEKHEELAKNASKTPPPSPEPKIKPEIFDNDHSTLLKVLRDEAEESNLSSMTPSLTELEAALSDMLEREDGQEKEETRSVSEKIEERIEGEKDKCLEMPIEPQIHGEKNLKKVVALPVSLKNILAGPEKRERELKIEEEDAMEEIDLTNDSKFIEDFRLVDVALDESSRGVQTEPPEKPSRLYQAGGDTSSVSSGAMPTPPRRRNRSGQSSGTLERKPRRGSSRTTSPEDPFMNDRLI